MIAWNIAHIARLVAAQEGAHTIIFTGSFMHDNVVSQVCSKRTKLNSTLTHQTQLNTH
jgi:pantothenate kinase